MVQGLPVPNLSRLRRLRFMTQEDLAERLGTNQQTVQRWEVGRSNPRLTYLKKLCELLEVSAEELTGNEKKRAA